MEGEVDNGCCGRTFLMTVAQYRQLPDRQDVIQELHWGMVVNLTRPEMRHAKLQSHLTRLLRPFAEQMAWWKLRLRSVPFPSTNCVARMLAFVSKERWDATDDDDNLHGSPELVIEILSPSNTKAEIHEKAVLCLSTGAREFWVLDAKRKTISVTPRDGDSVVYRIGDRIPLALFGGYFEVSEVFTV